MYASVVRGGDNIANGISTFLFFPPFFSSYSTRRSRFNKLYLRVYILNIQPGYDNNSFAVRVDLTGGPK